MRNIAVLNYDVWGIITISMRSTNRQDGSHDEVLQLQEADLGEHRHRHEVESSDEVDHAGYQIDQCEKYN